MKVPFHWVGGKSLWVDIIKQFIPQHEVYVEVFGGAGALLFSKERSKYEIYNDIDDKLVNFFRVLRDKEKFKELSRLLKYTLYSRSEYDKALQELNIGSDVERAHKFFIVAMQSFNCIFGSGWAFFSAARDRGKVWYDRTIVDSLQKFHERLIGVCIENVHFKKLFSLYDKEDVFFFCDPPYVPDVCKSSMYTCEMSIEEHYEFVDILLGLKGKAMVCGYINDVYKRLEENGWYRYDFDRVCYCVGMTGQLKGQGVLKERAKRTECLWINYSLEPNFL